VRRISEAEIAATRLVWALGYLVDENYFVPDGRFRFAPAAPGTWQCNLLWTAGGNLEDLGPAFEVAAGQSALREFRSVRD